MIARRILLSIMGDSEAMRDQKIQYLLTPKQVEWAYEKWCQGYTHVEIAEAMSVSYKTISRALKGKVKVKPILEYDWSKDDIQ